MRPCSAGSFLAPFAMVLGLWLIPAAKAHEGHDHGAPPPPVSKTIAPRADASSSDLEIVVVARGSTLLLFLDTFRTNEPIEGATIEIDAPGGILQLEAVAKEPGSYSASAPFLTKPGKYDLAITVTAKDLVDIFPLTLTIPEADGSAALSTTSSWLTNPALARDVQRRLTELQTSTWLYLILAFLAGAVTARIMRPRKVVKSSVALICLSAFAAMASSPAVADNVVASRDIAQRFPDGALFVPKPTQRILGLRTIFTEEQTHRRIVELPGRIVPNPNSSGLVQASVGGRLFAPEGGFKPLGTRVKAGEILAYVRPPLPLADATSQAQQGRELDQQISIAARKVERLRAIQQVIAKSQLEDAELELQGLTTRRASLDRAKREPEGLVAPVDGVIASANAVAGQMAEPNAVIYHIIDPETLWIEALSYDAQALEGNARAQLSDGRTLRLAHAGTGFADRNQAIPVHFAITEPTTGLRVGQFLTVLASTADVRRGVAVPRVAVLRGSNGQSLVFEHSNAERFVPREVRVEPLDGERVLIVAGIEPGRRIVTQGAELLSQFR